MGRLMQVVSGAATSPGPYPFAHPSPERRPCTRPEAGWHAPRTRAPRHPQEEAGIAAGRLADLAGLAARARGVAGRVARRMAAPRLRRRLLRRPVCVRGPVLRPQPEGGGALTPALPERGRGRRPAPDAAATL